MSEKTYYQKSKEVILNRAKDYYKNNKKVTNKITRSLNIFFWKENKRCYYFSISIYSAFTFQRPSPE